MLTQYGSHLAGIALSNITRDYPHKLDHVLDGPQDICSPRELHPVFYGSYDWHSSVHMHWLLIRLLRLYPAIPERSQIYRHFDAVFTKGNIAREADYFRRPSSRSFERPYGWAWLLQLQSELILLADTNRKAEIWCVALDPLASLLAERFMQFFPLAEFPIRAGTHGNSAFGMLLALEYANRAQHVALRKSIFAKANAWFGRDRRYPASYEPGGDDFLSGGLVEAALMRRVMDGCSYADWWEVFCPAPQELQTWLVPVAVTDRSDPKLAHLDGLNLSRAWCWRMIASELPVSLRASVDVAIEAHIAASLRHALQGDYAGTHWLASFAMLALSDV